MELRSTAAAKFVIKSPFQKEPHQRIAKMKLDTIMWMAESVFVFVPRFFSQRRRAWYNLLLTETLAWGYFHFQNITSSCWSNSQATGLKRYLAEFRFNSTFPSRGFPCNSFRSGNLKWKIKQPESGAGLRQSRSSVRPSFEDYSWIEFHPQIR